MYGIHRDPMGLYRGFMGSIGTLWVMYGIHRDPMGIYRSFMGSIGILRTPYITHRVPIELYTAPIGTPRIPMDAIHYPQRPYRTP